MKLPKSAIENYQFVLILVALALFVGLSSYLSMPRGEDPNPEFPNYTVIAIYPGVGPQDMEELVVDPIEEALEEISDINKVNTSIEEGVAVIAVEGVFGVDTDDLYDKVLREVNNARGNLPRDLFSLEVNQFKPRERVGIQQFGVVSGAASYATMQRIAEDFEYQLERLDGIQAAEVTAYPEQEVRISLDFQRMAAQKVSLGQIVSTLQAENLNIPGGDVQSLNKSFNIKSSGGFKSLDEIRSVVVSANGEKLVRLGDIAAVHMDYADNLWRARYMGETALWITVTQKEGVNLVRLSEQIGAVTNAFSERLPEDVKIVTAFEQAPAVKARINDFFANLMQGVLLVGIVIFLFLGFRSSVIIMVVIPLAIIMAIGALDFSGFALQQISIAALVIALGLLVDNGIVVVENIVRFQKEGYPLREAAYKGTAEVGYAVVSSTVTTLLAFAPLALLNSGAGEFLRSLPVTVILVLSASLILAITFTPIMASKVLSSKKRSNRKTGLISPLLGFLVQKIYQPMLISAMKRWYFVIPAALLIFAGSFSLFPLIGVSFFPTADKPLLLIEVDTPEGTNIDQTERAVLFVENVLAGVDYVRDFSSNTGHGNPMVYYNRISEQYKKNHAQLVVNFRDWDPERFYATLADLRYQFTQYPDALITFSELKNGPPFEAPIEIKVIGKDLDTLRRLAADLEVMIRETEGTLNVDNPLRQHRTNLKVVLNRDKAGMIGLPVSETDLAVRASLAGLKVDDVTLADGREYDLVVRLPFDEEPSVNDFDKVYFTTRTGAQVPLKQVAQIQFEQAVNQIQHYNFERNTAVTADVTNPDNTTAITEVLMEKLQAYELPDGYEFYVAGEYESQQETFGDLGTLLIIAMLGIFAVLVLQFRSLVQPLVVFSAVPLAITGSLIALYLTGWSFSFFAFVGFISLVGIVVNNSIILVDYTNQLRREGMKKVEALMQATTTRFTPIILTTTTTILGLLPLTLQSSGLWSPLGWTIIGGMISSTLLTLFIVPVLYKLFVKEEDLVVA
jgi:multidrug efflux pump subunit AcrB